MRHTFTIQKETIAAASKRLEATTVEWQLRKLNSTSFSREKVTLEISQPATVWIGQEGDDDDAFKRGTGNEGGSLQMELSSVASLYSQDNMKERSRLFLFFSQFTSIIMISNMQSRLFHKGSWAGPPNQHNKFNRLWRGKGVLWWGKQTLLPKQPADRRWKRDRNGSNSLIDNSPDYRRTRQEKKRRAGKIWECLSYSRRNWFDCDLITDLRVLWSGPNYVSALLDFPPFPHGRRRRRRRLYTELAFFHDRANKTIKGLYFLLSTPLWLFIRLLLFYSPLPMENQHRGGATTLI